MGPSDNMDGMMTALAHEANAGNPHRKKDVGLDSAGIFHDTVRVENTFRMAVRMRQ